MDKISLKIYLAGPADETTPVVTNLRQFCEAEFANNYEITIINVLTQPELARQDSVIATPTLVKSCPLPVRRILGDLSDRDALRSALRLNNHH